MTMKGGGYMEISCVDEFVKSLNRISKNAEKLDGARIPLEDLLTPSFLTENSKVSSLNSFFEQSPFTQEEIYDFGNIDENRLDEYVRKISTFATWSEFIGEATAIYVSNRLFD